MWRRGEQKKKPDLMTCRKGTQRENSEPPIANVILGALLELQDCNNLRVVVNGS